MITRGASDVMKSGRTRWLSVGCPVLDHFDTFDAPGGRRTFDAVGLYVSLRRRGSVRFAGFRPRLSA